LRFARFTHRRTEGSSATQVSSVAGALGADGGNDKADEKETARRAAMRRAVMAPVHTIAGEVGLGRRGWPTRSQGEDATYLPDDIFPMGRGLPFLDRSATTARQVSLAGSVKRHPVHSRRFYRDRFLWERAKRTNDTGKDEMEETWLATLQAATPEEGFALAVRISLMNLKAMQPSDEIRERLRTIYEDDAETLIAASQIIAINFQTIAAANQYWIKDSD
jgi:hypothetical protein